MREAVLNGVGLSVQFSGPNEALNALDSVTAGLIMLAKYKQIYRHLWMQKPPCQIAVCYGMSLYDLFQKYLGRSKDKARFMLGMVTKYPVEDGIEDGALPDYLETEIEGLSNCEELLWCAISGTKILVSLTPRESWRRNPLSFRLIRSGDHLETVDIENIFSEESAQNTVYRLNKLELSIKSPRKLWRS
ncbi:MAG: hypothetical protein OXC63_13485 [Aestuariivita sp.]|nr:hypothetical protein [Aestuariivita sp.]MCY4347910.1 hypothetical protein [Aestuariivita sp.]